MEQVTAATTDRNARGVMATLFSTLFAGLAPICGKLAYQAGVQPYTLVALRTALAAGLLWLVYLLFWRRYIAIDRRNLVGCIGMGVANGIGSLLYYNGLSRVDASLAHLLYSMYPFWVFIFLSAAGHPISRQALVRLALALVSVFLLTWQGGGLIDALGVTLMIGAGALYGFHLVLGQWTLVDVDSRTVTLYGLTTILVTPKTFPTSSRVICLVPSRPNLSFNTLASLSERVERTSSRWSFKAPRNPRTRPGAQHKPSPSRW